MSSPSQQGMSTQPSVGRFKHKSSSTGGAVSGGAAAAAAAAAGSCCQLLPKKPAMSTNAVGSKAEMSHNSGSVQSLAPQSNHGVLHVQGGVAQSLKPSDIVDLRSSGNTKDKQRYASITCALCSTNTIPT
jgi:hypothetical protein